MARRLSVDDVQILTLQDHLSGSEIELYYRMPTPAERVAFANMCVTRKNGKVKMQHAEARVKYGAIILTGFREGDFEVQRDGRYVALSCDAGSPNYDQAWKDKLKAMAPDIIELLALRVFEASVAIAQDDHDDEAEETTDQD